MSSQGRRRGGERTRNKRHLAWSVQQTKIEVLKRWRVKEETEEAKRILTGRLFHISGPAVRISDECKQQLTFSLSYVKHCRRSQVIICKSYTHVLHSTRQFKWVLKYIVLTGHVLTNIPCFIAGNWHVICMITSVVSISTAWTTWQWRFLSGTSDVI